MHFGDCSSIGADMPCMMDRPLVNVNRSLPIFIDLMSSPFWYVYSKHLKITGEQK